MANSFETDGRGPSDRQLLLWGEVPVAVAAIHGAALTLAELDGFLTARLARYKHPKDLVIVDALPRNPSGKVLKTELRQRFGRVD
ncbi:Probable fatty-acid-CoA ligase FadD [Mycobacteroides abscessus subsp. abscessus]|nr:Probable fatty-acid-CoA ligase FadD [Mycobacteroides abscessus subsp. abscessus]